MNFKIGDFVTRISYNHDVVFKVTEIVDNVVILKGINMRLYADSPPEDLVIYEEKKEEIIEDDNFFLDKVKDYSKKERNEYFYLPGRILHIDGDKDYLERCLKFYKDSNVLVFGIHETENEIPNNIKRHLDEVNPDILVITGHDAYYKRVGEKQDVKSYKNTENFLKAVGEARRYEKAHEKLIIIAGACQSNYEALIRAGANFASSPKRINIHALDPAVIALTLSLSDKSKDIDLIGILGKTKYGKDGVGGIITRGTMHVGYPR